MGTMRRGGGGSVQWEGRQRPELERVRMGERREEEESGEGGILEEEPAHVTSRAWQDMG